MQNQPQNQESREIRDIPLKPPFISTALLYLQAKMKELGIRYFGTEEQKQELIVSKDRQVWTEFTSRLEVIFQELQAKEIVVDTNTKVQFTVNLLMDMGLIKKWPTNGIILEIGQISFSIYGLIGLEPGYAGADLASQPNITIGYLDQRGETVYIGFRAYHIDLIIKKLKQIDPHPKINIDQQPVEVRQAWQNIVEQLDSYYSRNVGQGNPNQYLYDIKAVEKALQDQGYLPEKMPQTDKYYLGDVVVEVRNTHLLRGEVVSDEMAGFHGSPQIKLIYSYNTGRESSLYLGKYAGQDMFKFLSVLKQLVLDESDTDRI